MRFDEVVYLQGMRSVYREILSSCIQGLGMEDPAARGSAWILERERAIAMLREVCRDFGDNDWDEGLDLGDVIEKHLARHLYERWEGDMQGEYDNERT